MKRQRNKLQIYPKKAAIKEIRQVDVIAPPPRPPPGNNPPTPFKITQQLGPLTGAGTRNKVNRLIRRPWKGGRLFLNDFVVVGKTWYLLESVT
jgi:hypothetical protein